MRSIIGFGFGCSLLLLACTGGGGGDTPDAAACSATAAGSLVVNVVGLPTGATAHVTVTGPGGTQVVSATQTLRGLAGGTYTISAMRVIMPDAYVRSVYDATISEPTVCVGGADVTVTVTFTKIATSNKLWAINGDGGNGALLGFASSSLATSGSPSASIPADGPAGRSIAFDQDGNLWAYGPTTNDPTLVRFPASSFATGGAKTPDRAINLPGVPCPIAGDQLAFDKSGDLWLSISCDHSVQRLTPADLAASGNVTPSVRLTGVNTPTGLAFDTSGNLFVGDYGDSRIYRYEYSQLDASATTPAMSLLARTQADPGGLDIAPDLLAFDSSGALWISDFGANTVAKLAPTALAATGDTTTNADVVVTVGVGALLDSMAFDESGGLWLTYSQGKIARLDHAQLGTTTDAGNPTIPMTVLASPDMGYAGALAFYPPPSNISMFVQP